MNRYDEAIRRLAAELMEAKAPAQVERAVLAEFDRARRRRRRRVWIALAAAVVASLGAYWVVEKQAEKRPATEIASSVQSAGQQAPPGEAQSEQPFVPIPYVLPPAPDERVEVVRMELPVAALIAAGLEVRTADPGAQAEADVIFGQDGRARAVRLVSISSFN